MRPHSDVLQIVQSSRDTSVEKDKFHYGRYLWFAKPLLVASVNSGKEAFFLYSFTDNRAADSVDRRHPGSRIAQRHASSVTPDNFPAKKSSSGCATRAIEHDFLHNKMVESQRGKLLWSSGFSGRAVGKPAKSTKGSSFDGRPHREKPRDFNRQQKAAVQFSSIAKPCRGSLLRRRRQSRGSFKRLAHDWSKRVRRSRPAFVSLDQISPTTISARQKSSPSRNI